MNTLQELNNALDQQRRSLQLITARRKLLEKSVVAGEQLNYEGIGEQPFFYSAIGVDSEAGVLIQNGTPAILGDGNFLSFVGNVNIQEDAPFVWTHVGIALRELADPTSAASLQDIENAEVVSVFTSPEKLVQSLGSTLSLSVGFIESSSGRVLFQADERSTRASFQGQSPLFPTTLFDMARQNDIASDSPGHGSTGLWPLPKEVVLPASGSMQVVFQSSEVPSSNVAALANTTNNRYRAYVTLGGYKIKA